MSKDHELVIEGGWLTLEEEAHQNRIWAAPGVERAFNKLISTRGTAEGRAAVLSLSRAIETAAATA